MNHEDELANRIARLLDEGTDDLSADTRERLAHVRKLALSRQQGRKVQALVPALAGPISRVTEQSVFGVRYVIPLAALILGLIGVVYVNRSNLASDIADIDAGLLTDELPINAYLDQGFDSWLKRSSR
jgi:gamma-glutamyl phosphate reductase